jgi:hypothetical protein
MEEVMVDHRGRAEPVDGMDEESLSNISNKPPQISTTPSTSPILLDTSANATSSSDEEEEDSSHRLNNRQQDRQAGDEESSEDGDEASSFMNADLQACREGALAGMVQRVKPYHERYVGQIRRGRWEGRGRLVYSADDPRGRIDYDGEFRAGRRHGKGKLRWRNGCIYKGSWKDDMMQGNGSMKWPTGTALYIEVSRLKIPRLTRACATCRASVQGRVGEQSDARRGSDDVAESAGALRRFVVERQAIRPRQDHLR